MAFIVPLATAAASAIGSAVTGIGSALGFAGTAATTAAPVAAAASSGFSLWSALGAVGSAVSAFGQYQAGQAQAEAYRMASTNAIIQGNQQALEYQRQGIQVMRRLAETEATIRARGAAAGIDPFSGSAGQLADLSFGRAAEEYSFARDNASMAVLSGTANAAGYRSAAASASAAGLTNAIGTGLLGASRLRAIG